MASKTERIRALLEEILQEVDYDIYKSYFDPENEWDETKESFKRLMDIVDAAFDEVTNDALRNAR